jgi:hypothetical protein
MSSGLALCAKPGGPARERGPPLGLVRCDKCATTLRRCCSCFERPAGGMLALLLRSLTRPRRSRRARGWNRRWPAVCGPRRGDRRGPANRRRWSARSGGCAGSWWCCGEPVFVSTRRLRYVRRTSTAVAVRSSSVAAREDDAARSEWTTGAGRNSSPGSPSGWICRLVPCSASSTDARADAHGRQVGHVPSSGGPPQGHRQRRNHRGRPRPPRTNDPGHHVALGVDAHATLRTAAHAQARAAHAHGPRSILVVWRDPSQSDRRDAPRTRKRKPDDAPARRLLVVLSGRIEGGSDALATRRKQQRVIHSR